MYILELQVILFFRFHVLVQYSVFTTAVGFLLDVSSQLQRNYAGCLSHLRIEHRRVTIWLFGRTRLSEDRKGIIFLVKKED